MVEMSEVSDDINALSKQVLDVCFYVHTKLGPGLLESVYEECVYYFLMQKGIKVERQKSLPLVVDGLKISEGLRLDLLVDDKIIVELKTVEKFMPIHEAQLHTYLKLGQKPLGLLINFNVKSLRDGIKRIAMTR